MCVKPHPSHILRLDLGLKSKDSTEESLDRPKIVLASMFRASMPTIMKKGFLIDDFRNDPIRSRTSHNPLHVVACMEVGR